MTPDQAILDPQAKKLLQRVAASGFPPLHTLSAPDARVLFADGNRRLAGEPMAVHAVENLSAALGDRMLALRVYRPLPAVPAQSGESAAPRHRLSADSDAVSSAAPCLVYFHGGGWTIGDLDTHDNVCRHLALHGRCVVVSVQYRLAPEHKFPAALEDAVDAVLWIAAHAAELHIDPARMAVGGDSAGGNLAAVAAIAVREEPASPTGLTLVHQLLIYPATDMGLDTASHLRFAEGYYLTRESALWFRDNYLRGEADRDDWRASPLRARDLSGLPPAYVITAGFDPLRDEGRAYAERLAAAGVEVVYECFEGQIHGFVDKLGIMAAARHALHRAGQALQAAFGAFPAVR
jgi:acetyl esterase